MPTVRGPPLTTTLFDSGAEWILSDGIVLRVQFLEEDIVRVSVGKPETSEKKTWMVVDSSGDVPYEGKDKADLSRFTKPKVKVSEFQVINSFRLSSPKVSVSVFLDGDIRIESFYNDVIFFADSAFDAYRYNEEGGGFRHTLKSDPLREQYYGFGESSGILNKRASRLRIDARDAMGYDAETTDPLYKHWPYHMTIISEDNDLQTVCYGLLYDTMRRSVFDLGKEISAFRGQYRYFETQCWEKGLDYYLFLGPSPPDVSTKLIHLVGSPAIPPTWALGYLGSSMAYTESENAMDRLQAYLNLLEEHEIPCDGFHLSSGYTTDKEGRRCVFQWNHKRIPDPKAMFQAFESKNNRVIANVKPWLLQEHPCFESAKVDGCFFGSTLTAGPSVGRFWVGGAGTSGLGCYLDFTNEKSRHWWKTQAKQSLLEMGCRALWNDNNEYEVDESTAICSNGNTVEAQGRALHTLLMARASLEALREHFGPSEEVLVVSRSGSIGTHRYAAQTWSGDNSTSWKTLRFNVAMCLGLGLSGWVGSGPDVGGFAGQKPSEELFWRWVQSGVLMPRFSIHSSVWKTTTADSTSSSTRGLEPVTNEPWMFPNITSLIRLSIRYRYRLRPYLKSLHLEAHVSGAPVARPLLFHYANEPFARDESFNFLLGRNLLVMPVFEPGIQRLDGYVPGASEVWYDLHSMRALKGGIVQVINVPKRKDIDDQTWFAGTPVLLRAGGGFVMSGDEFVKSKHEGQTKRVVVLAIKLDGTASFQWHEDISTSVTCTIKNYSEVSWTVNSTSVNDDSFNRKKQKQTLSFDQSNVQVLMLSSNAKGKLKLDEVTSKVID